ncbi:MAG: glycoside hydrolase family 2 TIM barrel-domain containing protein [Sphaerochaeta sp.]|nr:glycoside hydrolase family 2 TIM barrel-domain containing protein [Sphaerochaeta sp.]
MDSRIIIRLDDWQFHTGDLGGIWEAIRPSAQDALAWESIALPHCFNKKDALDPDTYYYQGPAWYRTEITPANPYVQGKTCIFFEGAGQITDVYLDDRLLHTHIGGYDEWEVNLTPYLTKTTDTYTLSIRCDNSRNLERIPSDLADFTIYGGLYRFVNLVYEPEIHMEQLHLTALYDHSNSSGSLALSGRFALAQPDMEVKITLYDDTHAVVATREGTVPGKELELTIELDCVHPWSPETPLLYGCTVQWMVHGKVACRQESFGFRSFSFEKHGPLYLNGRRLLLRGTHRHEDHAGVGAAQDSSSLGQEMLLIKEMGANFIRLGHYQQSREVLTLCDTLGLLVWEEIPWCRGGLGGETYQQMGKSMLKNMITQHYNHPCIIIWGLGNENDWPGDFPTFDKQAIRSYMQELHAMAHLLDPNRKTAIRRCDFCKDIVDVYSPSLWAGWYRGHYREYRQATLKHIEEVDHFLHVEWGADSHANRFSEDPYVGLENLVTGIGTDEREDEASLYGGIARVSKDGNWSENYACDLFDWTLKEQLGIPELTGTAFWPFKDFATPLRGENPIPYVNQKGAVQRDLTKKEVYYVVQSYWSDKPMARLFGHEWKIRWGDEGESKEFRVYSNCPMAELFVDGKSVGMKLRDPKDFPAAGLRWSIPLSEGLHTVRVQAYDGDEVIEDGYEFSYQSGTWGEPTAIRSKFVRSEEFGLLWEIEVVDSHTRRCLDFSQRVRFSAAGKSPLVTEMGTATGSRVIECTNGRSSIAVRNAQEPAILAAWIEGLPLCSAPFPPQDE